MSHSAFDLTPFVHLLNRQDRQKRQRLSDYTRLLMQRQSDPSCAFCGLALAVGTATATALLPPWFGVAPTSDNAVLACRSCAKRKGQLDIIDEAFTKGLPAPLSASVLSLRSSMLLQADNHLTPQRRGIERDKLVKHLSERHAHPRCRVFACQSASHGFIGWRERVGNPHALSVIAALLKHSHRARLTHVDGTMLFQMEVEDFLEAVWALIELNALVVQLRVDGAVRPSMEEDWRHSWRYLSTSLNALRERRTVDGIAPRKPKELSMKPEAIRFRRHMDKKRERAEMIDLKHSLRYRNDLRRLVAESTTPPDSEVVLWYVDQMRRWLRRDIEDFE